MKRPLKHDARIANTAKNKACHEGMTAQPNMAVESRANRAELPRRKKRELMSISLPFCYPPVLVTKNVLRY